MNKFPALIIIIAIVSSGQQHGSGASISLFIICRRLQLRLSVFSVDSLRCSAMEIYFTVIATLLLKSLSLASFYDDEDKMAMRGRGVELRWNSFEKIACAFHPLHLPDFLHHLSSVVSSSEITRAWKYPVKCVENFESSWIFQLSSRNSFSFVARVPLRYVVILTFFQTSFYRFLSISPYCEA